MKNKVEIENTFHEAEKLRIKGNLKLAIKLFQNILNENPNFPPALNNIANCYFQLNEIGYAEKFYLKGLELDAAHLGINEYLGELYVETGRIELAKERLKTLNGCKCEEYEELKELIEKN